MTVGTGDFKQLLYAARDGDLETVRYWVRRGATLNFLHAEFLFTPLHISLRNNHLDIARYLLENGADPHLPEGYTNNTPLRIAQSTGNTAAVTLLEEFGVRVERGPWSRLKRTINERLTRMIQF